MASVILLILIRSDFLVSADTSAQYAASVAFINDQYYVFWLDQRKKFIDSTFALYGCRITKQGTVLDPEGVALYTDSVAYNCDVAFDNNNFFIVSRNHC